MNQEQYKLWVKELPQLSVGQLSDLSSRIKLLAKTSTKQHIGKQDFGDRVLQSISIIMRKVDGASAIALRKSAAYASHKQKIEDLSTFFESISKSKLVQDSILRMAIEYLYVDLLEWGVPVSSHTMLKQMHRIPATLNKHFPGYAQSGLLTKLVKGS